MKLRKISISRKELEIQTETEIFFFYMSNWFLSEIRTLKALYFHSMNIEGAEGVEVFGRNYRTMLLGCLLASKLWEGWQMLNQCYFSTPLHKEYEALYSSKAHNALKNIKQYFNKGDKTIICKLRQSTFHYPTLQEQKALKKYFSHGEYDSYFFVGNTFEQSMFNIDHFIANFAQRTDSKTVKQGISKLHEEIQQISFNFFIFLSEYIKLFQRKCTIKEEEFLLENAPKRLSVNIPFFTEK